MLPRRHIKLISHFFRYGLPLPISGSWLQAVSSITERYRERPGSLYSKRHPWGAYYACLGCLQYTGTNIIRYCGFSRNNRLPSSEDQWKRRIFRKLHRMTLRKGKYSFVNVVPENPLLSSTCPDIISYRGHRETTANHSECVNSCFRKTFSSWQDFSSCW